MNQLYPIIRRARRPLVAMEPVPASVVAPVVPAPEVETEKPVATIAVAPVPALEIEQPVVIETITPPVTKRHENPKAQPKSKQK